ncbi:MAG TPA: hypothetical protein VK533_07945, partial [Sphingomonas sp.]|nr:hypothetical protein [Sphingomonas sp.]
MTTFNGQQGSTQTFAGTSGFDTLTYASSTHGMVIDIAHGNSWDGTNEDRFSGIESYVGSVFNDVLIGGGQDDILDGGSGGVDDIRGGGGDDIVSYQSSSTGVSIDLVSQQSWDGTSVDALSSIEGAWGSNLNDTIAGSARDEMFQGFDGSDYIDGGGGDDTISYASSTHGMRIDLTAGNSWDGVAMDGFTSIENVIGTSHNDVIVGSAADNVFDVSAGGSDNIDGAGGNDTLSYAGSALAVIVSLVDGTTWDGAEMDGFTSIENVVGSSLSDIIIGDNGDNVLDGGTGGADNLIGGGGNDTVSYINDSNVRIDLLNQNSWDFSNVDAFSSIENAIGSRQSDVIRGSGQGDVINGWAGNDVLVGVPGQDTFEFKTSDGTGIGQDTIYNFDPSDDKLAIDSTSLIGSFSDVSAHAVQVGSDLVLYLFGTSDRVQLVGINLASLS